MFGALRMAPLPIIFAIIFTIQIFIVYTWAVVRGDVDPVFPYLSSAADKRPEACIFSMFTNICSMLSFWIIYLRYKFTSALHTNDSFELPKLINSYSRFVGYAAAIGMFVVANVQETAVIPIHMTAAFVTFGGGTIYMCLQTYVTYCMAPVCVSYRMFLVRAIFSIIAFFSFILAVTFGITAANVFHSYYPDLPTPRPWSRKMWQPGFEFHMASAVFEWTVAVFHVMFIVSFAQEFEDIIFELKVSHENEEDTRNRLIGHRVINPRGW